MINKFTISLSNENRNIAVKNLEELIINNGGEIIKYPEWHPLDYIKKYLIEKEVFDHVILLKNAIIISPYTEKEKLIKIIKEINEQTYCSFANVKAEQANFNLYQDEIKPIIICCKWLDKYDEYNGTEILTKHALSLIFKKELIDVNSLERTERWDMMKPIILGITEQKNSNFVSKETKETMKSLWGKIEKYEIYGSVKTNE